MNEILIPTLLFWKNGNTWYGSKGNARFFIQPVTPPQQEEQPTTPDPVLQAELWPGPLCKELSQVIATASFPLSEEGLGQLTQWLEEQAAPLNSSSS
ncbi:hypothetical protein [Flavonifractor sp. An100]|uniref:hypothetical protein n=1 Tax=Flavonifractor sp. An100 TaxID=1965538 RepID=UPI000B367D93|nr:hypothetical protein [Flavonifractor sp. An100]OUQ81657.1 hypothetical protein B5E43_01880 [Flavonifractor sp. An100]